MLDEQSLFDKQHPKCTLCQRPTARGTWNEKPQGRMINNCWFCNSCAPSAGIVKRYQSDTKKQLTPGELAHLFNNRTIAAGPRKYGK